jgi:CheY-like chemotaxis protein
LIWILQTTILIVDDDEMVRDSLRAVLESRNLSVADFTSGQDFLARRYGFKGSCLLLDIHMPGMTGVDLLKTLRERGDAGHPDHGAHGCGHSSAGKSPRFIHGHTAAGYVGLIAEARPKCWTTFIDSASSA